MAEALLRLHADEHFEALSSGLNPKGVHPLTLRVLREKGIDTIGLRSKGTEEFLGKVLISHAIVVCDKAQENCPQFYPFTMNNLFWPFDDPAAFVGSEAEQLAEFRRIRDQIDEKIRTWLRGLTAVKGNQ